MSNVIKDKHYPSEDTLTQRKWNEAIKVAIVINISIFFLLHTHKKSHTDTITNCVCTPVL
jgi:hypothetical protein